MPHQPILITSPGDLLSTSTEAFRLRAEASLESGAQFQENNVEIDLRMANMVDSVGLNAIVAIIRKAKAAGRKIRITVTNQHLYRVLVFTRIDRQAEILLDKAQAQL